MYNNDRNFQRAHEQYLTPPEEPDEMRCTECDGDGTVMNDAGEQELCKACNGEGYKLNDEATMFEAMLSAQEDKADARREDDFFDNDTEDGMERH